MNKKDIGTTAGLVWKTLDHARDRMTIPQLIKSTGMEHDDVIAAIGWLAREDKILFTHCKNQDYVSLYENFYF